MEKVLVLLICAIILAGCAATIFSSWNEDDARVTAEILAGDILSGNWLREYNAANKGMPVILLYKLENRSSEPFPLCGLEDKLALDLLASGKVKMVMPKDDFADHDDHINQILDSELPIRESGADILLKGSIDTLADKSQLIFQLELKLIEAQSGNLLHRAFRTHQKPLKQPKKRTA
ncbi:MAG: hypothetical protein R6T89_06905 [Candidatus Syntrophosphaera sp.]